MAGGANPLDIRTVLTQVHTALVDVIDLAYSVRYPEAVDLAALSARDAQKLPDRALIFVMTEGVVYRWSTASRLTPAPPYVVMPLALPAQGNGRWLRQSSSVTLGPAYFRPLHRVRSGFAHAVQPYEGQDDAQLERIFAQIPAYLVEWVSDELPLKSYRHGVAYECDLRYTLHCIAQNLRGDASALVGSEVASDSAPGLYDLIGAARYLLAGCNLGLGPGVKYVDVQGSARIIEADLAQRHFRAEVDLVVKASVHIVDEDLFPSPEVWIERRDAGTPPGESFDASNFLALGCAVTPGPGLTGTVTSGVAYLAGQIVSSPAVTRLWEPDADTYRDLAPDGTFRFTAVDPDSDPPPQRPGSLRVGMTRTDATSIVADSLLCSYSVPSGTNPGDPFRVA